MSLWIQTLITVLCTALASSGFWAYFQKKSDKKDANTKMLLGLGHDRITWLGTQYINRGWITSDEYENLYDYLYKPYSDLGGNGTAKKIMDEVSKLEIRQAHDGTTSTKHDKNVGA